MCHNKKLKFENYKPLRSNSAWKWNKSSKKKRQTDSRSGTGAKGHDNLWFLLILRLVHHQNSLDTLPLT